MNSDRPKSPKDLPDALKGVLEGLPRISFARRPAQSQDESESPVQWGVRDLGDLVKRTTPGPARKK